MKIRLEPVLHGSILDVGGGGEGIIGRLYAQQVVAIDNRQEELDEAPDGFQKLLMDATDLQFADGTFDNVTFFFSLMYMDAGQQALAVGQAARVLKAGGALYIWDCEIASAWPAPFCLELEVLLPAGPLAVTYGVGKRDAQSQASILEICRAAGLSLCACAEQGGCFFLVLCKPAQTG